MSFFYVRSISVIGQFFWLFRFLVGYFGFGLFMVTKFNIRTEPNRKISEPNRTKIPQISKWFLYYYNRNNRNHAQPNRNRMVNRMSRPSSTILNKTFMSYSCISHLQQETHESKIHDSFFTFPLIFQ